MDNESISALSPTSTGGDKRQKQQQPQQHQQPQTQSLRQDECDYDDSPTVLYQAIEAKQWDYAIKLFSQNLCEGESSTWILRKETNGKLRWRLLPLHAAIIFGSPVKLVECLLADYPEAAQCKDDRGMLPLHLAFRNEGAASWEIIEELVSVFPQAIFVKDRKGRTPLQCGIQLTTTQQQQPQATASASTVTPTATAVSSAASSSNMSVSSGPHQSNTFKSIVTVLDLYSQVVVSGERQRSQKDARKQVESKITQMQENHLQTLTTLKREWTAQQVEASKEIQRLQREQQLLLQRVKEQQMTIENLKSSEVDLQHKLNDMSIKMMQHYPQDSSKNHDGHSKPFATVRGSIEASAINTAPVPASSTELSLDDRHQVESTIHMLWEERTDYHNKCQSMMKHLERLTKERTQVLGILLKGDSLRKNQKDESDEKAVLDDCRKWLAQQGDRSSSSRLRYRPSLPEVSTAHHLNMDATISTTTNIEKGDEKKDDNNIQSTVLPAI